MSMTYRPYLLSHVGRPTHTAMLQYAVVSRVSRPRSFRGSFGPFNVPAFVLGVKKSSIATSPADLAAVIAYVKYFRGGTTKTFQISRNAIS